MKLDYQNWNKKVQVLVAVTPDNYLQLNDTNYYLDMLGGVVIEWTDLKDLDWKLLLANVRSYRLNIFVHEQNYLYNMSNALFKACYANDDEKIDQALNKLNNPVIEIVTPVYFIQLNPYQQNKKPIYAWLDSNTNWPSLVNLNSFQLQCNGIIVALDDVKHKLTYQK